MVCFGIYRKIEGKTGVGKLYQVLFPTRNHTTGRISVIYIPLRVEPEWAGTIRPCDLWEDEFEMKFAYVGETLPAMLYYPELVSENDERDMLLSKAQHFLRDGHNDDLSRAIAEARNILNSSGDR